MAGTCCQSLSRVRIESKEVNNGLDGKSGIFFKAIECLMAIQPKYFMFENVIPSSDEDLKTMTDEIIHNYYNDDEWEMVEDITY